jgi:hypothetical protein
MIEAPLVPIEPAPGRLDRFDDFLRDVGRTGGRIIEIEQRLRKAVKVVDGARPGHGGYRRRANEPVSGDGQHRARPGKRFAHRAPCIREVVALERIHRATVTNEQCGHLRHAVLPKRDGQFLIFHPLLRSA